MLLKRISLKNFRQFRNPKTIEFSTDKKRNVTIIMADNGVGKTTLAQAFQWVLYANVEGFRKNKSVLNLKEEKEMSIGDITEVEVKIEFEHASTQYSISRTQKFIKDGSGTPRRNPTEVTISYIGKDGQVEFIEDSRKLSTIKEILPEELSKYFFFDGERINTMTTEINNKGKSTDFSDAVEGLLGLKPLKQIINHMNPRASTSVIGKFEKEMDLNGDQTSRKLSDEIYELNDNIEYAEKRLDEIKELMNDYNKKRDRIINDLIKSSDVEKLQQRANLIEKEIEMDKELKSQKIKNLLKEFSARTPMFLQRKLIDDAISELSKADKVDAGIPYVRDETIKFLLNRKRCICGADLSDNTSDAVRHLIKEIELVPPISIGSSIKKFVDESKEKIKLSEDFYDNFKTNYADIRRYTNNILEKEDERSKIDDNILKNSKVAELKREQLDCENQINKLENEKEKLIGDLEVNKQKRDNLVNERERLVLVNEKNKKVQLYRKYATIIYNQINTTYKREETKTREELKDAINKLFEKIYGKGMYIDVDEQYHIKVLVNELIDDESFSNVDIDYSTAQCYSVIFAFIVGIMELAKKRTTASEEHLIDTEEYPLVMDAPLSAFDNKRIKNICNTIPGIARQVIIIIKDTDGNIAKDNLYDSIGKEYEIKPQAYSAENSVIESYFVEKEVF